MRGGVRRRGLLLTAVVWAAAIGAAAWLAVVRYTDAVASDQPDLTGFFIPAAEAIAAGLSPYSVPGYYYPPVVALLLAPFAGRAGVAEYWTVLRLVAAVLFCFVATLAFTPRARWRRRGWLMIVAVISLFYCWPVVFELWAGQPNLLVALALAGAALAQSRGASFAAGLLIGASAVVKGWTAIFAIWIARRNAPRRLRELGGLVAAGGIALVLALLVGGPRAVVDMISSPLKGSEQPALAANSIWGISRMLFSRTTVGEPLLVSPPLQVALAALLGVVLVGLLIIILRWPGDASAALFNCVLVVLLLLPVSHYYYLVLALPVLWWWVARLLADRRDRVALVVTLLLAFWWVTVFRLPPSGDGFMTTTWPSLLRVFGVSLVAAAASVIGAAMIDRRRVLHGASDIRGPEASLRGGPQPEPSRAERTNRD